MERRGETGGAARSLPLSAPLTHPRLPPSAAAASSSSPGLPAAAAWPREGWREGWRAEAGEAPPAPRKEPSERGSERTPPSAAAAAATEPREPGPPAAGPPPPPGPPGRQPPAWALPPGLLPPPVAAPGQRRRPRLGKGSMVGGGLLAPHRRSPCRTPSPPPKRQGWPEPSVPLPRRPRGPPGGPQHFPWREWLLGRAGLGALRPTEAWGHSSRGSAPKYPGIYHPGDGNPASHQWQRGGAGSSFCCPRGNDCLGRWALGFCTPLKRPVLYRPIPKSPGISQPGGGHPAPIPHPTSVQGAWQHCQQKRWAGSCAGRARGFPLSSPNCFIAARRASGIACISPPLFPSRQPKINFAHPSPAPPLHDPPFSPVETQSGRPPPLLCSLLTTTL